MKIVVLDGHALNPGDISWAGLQDLGEITIYDQTSYTDEQEIIERIGNAHAVFTNKVVITAEVLEQCSAIQYIGVLATGYNTIALEAARKKKIVVTNIPSYGTDAVAQFTFALLLEIVSQVGIHNDSVHAGDWLTSQDFTYWKSPLQELSGKTMGLIGYGAIAQAVAEIAKAFKMNVIYYNHQPKKPKDPSFYQVSLDKLYQQSDIISLHIPQVPDTEKMIDDTAIHQMKKTAVLINTARGGLIDEQAVARALNENRLQALGADVVSVEPMKADNPLLGAKNCYLTPHIAWAPIETRTRLMEIAVDNFQHFLKGKEKNRVN